jgi:hypothetical protein
LAQFNRSKNRQAIFFSISISMIAQGPVSRWRMRALFAAAHEFPIIALKIGIGRRS